MSLDGSLKFGNHILLHLLVRWWNGPLILVNSCRRLLCSLGANRRRLVCLVMSNTTPLCSIPPGLARIWRIKSSVHGPCGPAIIELSTFYKS
jgi:hypothetical protein